MQAPLGPVLLLALIACSSACSRPVGSASAAESRGSSAKASGESADEALLAQAEAGDASAAAALRRRGYAGLDALLARLDALGPGQEARARRLRTAVDRVARQRDAHASRLYWHTDLDEAKARAQAEGKPILSLRLLGDLGDELSCANSRLFRAVLYPDERVRELLRRRFVLHWSSERPAPRLTVDYGDGRTITRTVTGNSAHYVLDARGRPVDVIPGLYGPAAFAAALSASLPLAERSSALDGDGRRAPLLAFHQGRVEALKEAWSKDLQALGRTPDEIQKRPLPPPLDAPPLWPSPVTAAAPSALDAAPIALGKAAIELGSVRALLREPPRQPAQSDAALWSGLARRHQEDGRLGPASQAFITAQRSFDWSKAGPGDLPAERKPSMLRVLEANLALDTVQNEYARRFVVHQWFASGDVVEATFDALNARVYSSLFRTPRADPWLGLSTPEVYSGLDGDGVVTSSVPAPGAAP